MSEEPESGAGGEHADEEESRFGAIANRIADRRARSGARTEPASDGDNRDSHDPIGDNSSEDAPGESDFWDDSSDDDPDEGGTGGDGSNADNERPASDRSPTDTDVGADSNPDTGTDGHAVGGETPAGSTPEGSSDIEQLTGQGTRALTLVDTGRDEPWSFFGGDSTLRGKHLLVVSVGGPSPGLRRVWEQTADGPGRRGLVQVGDVPPDAEPYDERFADVVKRVPSRSNVSRLGIIVSQAATGFAKHDGRTLVAIDSFTDLAAQTTTQTLFRFGYLLESQFSSHGIHGFCGLAERSHSAAELTTLEELFDTAIESTGDSFSVRQIEG